MRGNLKREGETGAQRRGARAGVTLKVALPSFTQGASQLPLIAAGGIIFTECLIRIITKVSLKPFQWLERYFCETLNQHSVRMISPSVRIY